MIFLLLLDIDRHNIDYNVDIQHLIFKLFMHMINVIVHHGRAAAHVNAVIMKSTVMNSKLHSRSKLQQRVTMIWKSTFARMSKVFTILIRFDQQVLMLCRALASAIEPCSARPLLSCVCRGCRGLALL
jgi:hypothetical protein